MPTKNRQTNASNKTRAFDLLNRGKIAEGRALLADICGSHPQDMETLLALGVADGMLGNFNAAEEALRRVLSITPDHAGAHFNLGKAQQKQGKLEEARESYTRACQLQPESAGIHNNLGNVLKELGYTREARQHLEQAAELEPHVATYQYNLGNALNELGLREQAVTAYQMALASNPGLIEARSALGNAQLQLGKLDEAQFVFDQLLQDLPNHQGALAGKAAVLNKQGKFSMAAELLEPHLQGDDVDAFIAATFARFAHHIGRTRDAAELIERLLKTSDLSKTESARLNFALGYLYDRNKQYDKAFSCYATGNKFRSKQFDIREYREHFAMLVKIFSPAFMADAPRAQNTSEVPVFIVGMPRSGTSLVEQILANHPKVYGAGELSLLGDVASSIHDHIDKEADPVTAFQQLLSGEINKFAADYLDPLVALAPAELRITDKMPANFMHLGLIDLLFPQARIIHCRRNPLDTCLSVYFQDFIGNHPYSNDLTSVGQFYLEYVRLMQHWQSVLRVPVFEVNYESLVTDAASLIPEIVAFCGLDWDDDCLNFNNNRRTVATSSYDQVRRPIYTSSIERWHHYERYIGELTNALGMQSDKD